MQSRSLDAVPFSGKAVVMLVATVLAIGLTGYVTASCENRERNYPQGRDQSGNIQVPPSETPGWRGRH